MNGTREHEPQKDGTDEQGRKRLLETTPAGWRHLTELGIYLLGPARWRDEDRRRIVEATRREGLLHLETSSTPGRGAAGVLKGLSGVSRETCERCGGPGEALEHADGTRAGTWCTKCRPVEPTLSASALHWRRSRNAAAEQPPSGEPEWRWETGRALEERIPNGLEWLMDGGDPASRYAWLGVAPGWRHLMRAALTVLLPLQAPQAERPPWRMADVKEKFGRIRLHGTSDPYYSGIETVIGKVSAITCISCGQPGTTRLANFIRPECDPCWKKSPGTDHETDAERRAENAARGIWEATEPRFRKT